MRHVALDRSRCRSHFAMNHVHMRIGPRRAACGAMGLSSTWLTTHRAELTCARCRTLAYGRNGASAPAPEPDGGTMHLLMEKGRSACGQGTRLTEDTAAVDCGRCKRLMENDAARPACVFPDDELLAIWAALNGKSYFQFGHEQDPRLWGWARARLAEYRFKIGLPDERGLSDVVE